MNPWNLAGSIIVGLASAVAGLFGGHQPTFGYVSNPTQVTSSTVSAAGGLTGNSTSTYIAVYSASGTLIGYANFSYVSSTAMFNAPSGTYAGTLAVGTSTAGPSRFYVHTSGNTSEIGINGDTNKQVQIAFYHSQALVGQWYVPGNSTNLVYFTPSSDKVIITSAGAMSVLGGLNTSSTLSFAGPLSATSTLLDTLSNCGTSATSSGSNGIGRLTTGNDASSTCTVTFGTAFRNKPICTISPETVTFSNSTNTIITPAATSVLLSMVSSTAMKSATVDYICIGQ